MDTNLFPLRKLVWRQFFHQYTTPRDWKKGARDVPFGLGAKTLYVDGDNGNDHNDGLSWKTAFKTIQAAVDAADSWTNIYIKSATYPENVEVEKDGIKLIGQNCTNVIVKPDSGTAIDITANGCLVTSLTAIGNGTGEAGLLIGGLRSCIYTVVVGNQNSSGYGLITGCNFVHCKSVITDSVHVPGYGFSLYGGDYIEVEHCIIDSVAYDAFVLGSEAPLRYSLIHDNTIVDPSRHGINGSSAETIVFHNNFIGCGSDDINDPSSQLIVLENYYDDHSNVDNGFGIATEPFSFIGGSDPRPVVYRNGWLALSWADADQVALASVCTEARLAELDAANIPADIDTLLARLTDARAGYLDNLSGGAVALASVCTDARLAELDAANMPADLDTLLSRLTDARAGYLDELDAANIPADIDTLLSRLTAARAGYLDELDFDLDARLGSPVSSIAGDIADLITRTKGLDDIHDDLATVDSVADAILANQKKYWHWNALSGDYRVMEGTWQLLDDAFQYLGCLLYNYSDHLDDEIVIPFFVPSTDTRTLNIRGKTKSDAAIITIYVDNQSQGTIDFYSSSTVNNAIKTISITPARAGLNVLKITLTDSNPSSSDYYCYISEMWLT